MNTTTAQSETTSIKVPAHLLTSPHCVVVPVGNDYRHGRHSYRAGQQMVVDLDAVPKHDDFVIVFSETQPFGRICHIPPAAQAPREEMIMGTLDTDGRTVHLIHLGKDGRQFGVAVGIVPRTPARKKDRTRPSAT